MTEFDTAGWVATINSLDKSASLKRCAEKYGGKVVEEKPSLLRVEFALKQNRRQFVRDLDLYYNGLDIFYNCFSVEIKW